MPTAGFEPSISGSERPQTYALGRAATGIGTDLHCDYHPPPPLWPNRPYWARASSIARLHEHTQRNPSKRAAVDPYHDENNSVRFLIYSLFIYLYAYLTV